MQYIGKIDRNKFERISANMTTEEVILTDKQVKQTKLGMVCRIKWFRDGEEKHQKNKKRSNL